MSIKNKAMEEIIAHKIDYVISAIVAIFSAIFGHFWFLFAFLLFLNVVDYITGIIKAKYLKNESSRMATKGFAKKIFIWCLVGISFGLSFVFVSIGQLANINFSFMSFLGWFMLIHAIINECRSIIENIVECDKGYIVPSWMTKSLEITNKLIEKNVENVLPIKDIENEKKENEKEGDTKNEGKT